MPIYSAKPLEVEDFDTVQPLGTDRAVFGQLEEKWRNLRAVRRLILAPASVLGSVAPFFYVAIWPMLRDFRLDYNAEWWMWQFLAVLMGLLWAWVAWVPYKSVLQKESTYDEALDALDAKDYFNEHLVELSTGRRVSSLNNLSPLSKEDLVIYNDRTKDAGPQSAKMWQRWVQQNTDIRVCDLFTLEKMILKEQWSKKE